MSLRQTAGAIDLTAAEWAARLDARALTVEEQHDLEAWLARDPRHLGALARARALLLGPQGADAVASALPAAAPSGLVPALYSRRRLLATAAGVAGLMVAGATLRRGDTIVRQAFSSLLGEIRHIPLEDGSQVVLNTDSAISVEFSASQRLVRLERGEAYFDVAKNAERPFVVRGALAQMLTVGTAYGVRLLGAEAMTVAVLSGKVAIEGAPSALAETLGRWTGRDWALPTRADDGVLVGAGQEATIRQGGPGHGTQVSFETAAKGALERALMWREGRLAFEGETLAQAAAEFARYSAQRIVLASDRLGQRRISGLFQATDLAGFARAAAISFGAKYKEEGGNIILSD